MAGLGSPALKMAPVPHTDAIFAEIIAAQAGRTLSPTSCAHRLPDSRLTSVAGAHPAAQRRQIEALRTILRLAAALTLAARIMVSPCVAHSPALDPFLRCPRADYCCGNELSPQCNSDLLSCLHGCPWASDCLGPDGWWHSTTLVAVFEPLYLLGYCCGSPCPADLVHNNGTSPHWLSKAQHAGRRPLH